MAVIIPFPIEYVRVLEAAKAKNQLVVLKTVSGEEIVGYVLRVKKGVVVLKAFKSKIYVALNKVTAIIVR
ncbi:hypothetical protein [Paenibacillus glycanilyticus]|uniref:Uncharacterized protein n=1 Tax=Paenibacillus glycanilyticus TaxID=126569 RepID=A0ABQ6GEH3_9BACL|nr:hypothetical protein [Paenibacillus glycanilyticus]GLX67986.1 hypothetical protein MU1_23310 [Paenibacillus glycanilyticus]